MPPEAIITIVIFVVVVLVLAAFLITLAFVLWRVSVRLQAVVAGVDPAPERNEDVQAAIASINSDLSQGRASLEAILSGGRPAGPGTPAERGAPGGGAASRAFDQQQTGSLEPAGPDRPDARGASGGGAASRAFDEHRQR